MATESKTNVTVQNIVNANIEKVWQFWNLPEHIINWCQASDDWHAPASENDLRVGGTLKTTMAAKDGSVSFDFEAVYTAVELHKLIEYSLLDDRKVSIIFEADGDTTKIIETFEIENVYPKEMQEAGWQAILDSFKKYTENN